MQSSPPGKTSLLDNNCECIGVRLQPVTTKSPRNKPGLVTNGQETVGEVEETDGYQQFYQYCRDSSTGPSFLDTLPYKLSLGMSMDGTGIILPFHLDSTLGGQILVTESYNNRFNHIGSTFSTATRCAFNRRS